MWNDDEVLIGGVIAGLLVIGLIVVLLFVFSGSDINETVVDNALIENCQLIGYDSRMSGKTTYYYITVQKEGIRTEYETDSDTYDSLKELKETAKALNKSEDFMIDVIVDVNEKQAIAVALANNRK
jgi:hypothetical protein